jgi:hypothetical protein
MSQPITNIQRFAVVHKKHGVIAVVAPDEDFCHKYCSRENIAFGFEAYHVVPHDEPVKTVKNNGIYFSPKLPEPIKPKDIKSKIADYLKKKST